MVAPNMIRSATVRELISVLPGLNAAIREQCREAKTLGGAEQAARAAQRAAWATRRATEGAAEEAVSTILTTACQLWIRAATDTEGL